MNEADINAALDPALNLDPALAGPPHGDDGQRDGGASIEEIDAAVAAHAAVAAAAALASQDALGAGDEGDTSLLQDGGDDLTPGKSGGKRKDDGSSGARLAKGKVAQCNQLRDAAEKALEGVWAIIDENDGIQDPKLKIARSLDRNLGELHALAGQYKPDYKALIWIADIPLKSIRENYRHGPGPAYNAIKKANIALVAEYLLYAMPDEDGYGKNDLVFACEGLLPLIPPVDLLDQEETWSLFNQLKIQIYIQRLDVAGMEDADTRVLPNLFVESLSSYSGHQFPDDVQDRFDAMGKSTQAEIMVAQGDLQKLEEPNPYPAFVLRALKFLKTCSDRVDAEMAAFEASLPGDEDRPKKSRKPNHFRRSRGIGGLADAPGFGMMAQLAANSSPGQASSGFGDDSQHDIQVDPLADDPNYQGETGRKPRFNPYRLGRGKGAMAAPRRRWTDDELDLLIEEVRLHANKYDCMAQIIKRHGKDGEISTVLKDQNNVSLKDKARNLTMEWARKGPPPDKPWVLDAFARFGVKGRK